MSAARFLLAGVPLLALLAWPGCQEPAPPPPPPRARLELLGEPLEEGGLQLGRRTAGVSHQAVVQLNNAGALTASDILLSTEGDGLRVSAGDCPQDLPQGVSCELQVELLPRDAGALSTVLRFGYRDLEGELSLEVPVHATVLEKAVRADPESLQAPLSVYGYPAPAVSLTLRNESDEDVTQLFSFLMGTCSTCAFDWSLAVGSECGQYSERFPAGASCRMDFTPSPMGSSALFRWRYTVGERREEGFVRLQGGPVIYPATLSPLQGSRNPFPLVDAGARTTMKLPVVNHTGPFVPMTPVTLSASSVTGRPLAAPFSFTGGAYPGTEGTCGEVIDGGTLCQLDLTFSPEEPGDYEGSVTLDYFDGWDAGRSATFRITGQAR